MLVNGKVITVDPADAVAQAVAISGGRIVAVGSTADVKARIGRATQVVELGGRAVTPGLIDTHIHFTEVDQLFSIDLSDPAIKAMNDVVSRVAAQVARTKPGNGCSATAGTRASWPSGGTSPPPTSTPCRRTTRCGWATLPGTTASATPTR